MNENSTTARQQENRRRPVPGLVALDFSSSREEISLSEFPITTMTQRNAGVTEFPIEELVHFDQAGNPVYRRWTIVGTQKFGLPIAGDEEIYVAIMKLAEHYDFTERIIPATRYQVCQLLGLKPDGKVYRRIAEAFYRLRHTSFVHENVFREPSTGALIRHKSFGIIDAFQFADRTSQVASPVEQNGFPLNYFRLSDEFLERVRQGHKKRLDLDFYRKLSTYLSKRLFRFFDKNRHRKTDYEIYLAKLAGRVGLLGTYTGPQLRRLFRRPLEELQGRGLLDSYSFEKGIEGWKLHVTFNAGYGPAAAKKPSSGLDVTPERKIAPNAPMWASEGVQNKASAERLVRRFHERIHGTLDQAPTKGEVAKANELLTMQSGYDLALYTVDFACDCMRQSNWTDVQNFGAVLSNGYPDRAREAYAAEQKERARREALDKRHADEARYLEWRDQEETRRWNALDPSDRDRRIADAVAELTAKAGESGTRLWSEEAKQRTAERRARAGLMKDLPTFEDWLSRQEADPHRVS